ncbi:DUF2933 domain-containing protein [Modestobacter muralis]|uniref:DUF2933 domain-containing protein n=1 Tax=Modestobacter muralis TaxID=1608614 RepID=A0A6P0H3D7_9ACTN|nr:DUF2933 domain-containing protein [Modestobacter muralis]NEK93364.1 DUF2933 domain-containing protein [Modestobacter muralis]NEN50131.1 DUF2933 domain-containing protein [Modestobacter muralis]
MNHGKHLYVMVGFAVLAGVLWLTGAASGGSLGLLWLGACAFMMFFMMRGMGGSQDGGDESDESERHVEHRH